MGWRLQLPQENLDLRVEPVVKASEFDARTTTFNVYWEGPVKITGTRTGVGFVELSGYHDETDLLSPSADASRF